MIKTFDSKETGKIWEGIRSSKLPIEIQQIGRRKHRMLNNSVSLVDLRIPPSNRLEKLKGEQKDYIALGLMINGELFLNGIMGIRLKLKLLIIINN